MKGVVNMDEFLRTIYADVFFYWILHNEKRYFKDNIYHNVINPSSTHQTIIFELEHATGYIRFWQENIIEEEIVDLDGKNVFYLHYNIISIKQCTYLFNQFYEVLCHYSEVKNFKIALCCSGGLTTALFAINLQNLSDLQKLHFEFSAFGVDKLKSQLENFDAILLAPQIAYTQPQLMKLVNKKIPIICINPIDFATNQFQHIINTLNKLTLNG